MRLFFLMAFALVLLVRPASAQKFSSAGEYMTYISNQYREVTKDYWSYAAAVAHGKSARKIENRREGMLKTVKESEKNITAMAAWENDKSYRDSAKAYLQKLYHLLNDDYGKIVDLEAVAEQ